MITKGKFFVVLLFLTIFGSSIFAQSSASLDEPVLIQILKGLSMTKVGGDLDFGEYVITSADETLTKTPDAGVNFEVTGFPGRAVTITYANVTLDNNTWVGTNGGTTDNLTFVPNVESTAGNNTYSGASSVISGGSVNLTNDGSGLGKLYLWVGGSIDVATTTEQGDYTGTFTLTVAY
jgi:hypothetical protein